MKSRKCDVCNIDVRRASYVKRLKSKKHIENEKEIEMIISEWVLKRLLKVKHI